MGLKNYEKLKPDGWLFQGYCILETMNDDLMEYLRVKGLRIKVLKEYQKKGRDYKILICRIWKKEEDAFLKALSDFISEEEKKEIPYGEWCREFNSIFAKEEG